MKKLIFFLSLGIFVLFSVSLKAQNSSENLNNSKMEEQIEKQVEKLGIELELDDLQKALLKANLKEYNTKALILLKSEDSREQLKESLSSLRKKQKEDLLVFLNEEQLQVFEKLQKKERNKNRSNMRRQRQRY